MTVTWGRGEVSRSPRLCLNPKLCVTWACLFLSPDWAGFGVSFFFKKRTSRLTVLLVLVWVCIWESLSLSLLLVEFL